MGYLLKIIVAVSHFSKGVIGYTLYRKTIKPEELRLRYDTYKFMGPNNGQSLGAVVHDYLSTTQRRNG